MGAQKPHRQHQQAHRRPGGDAGDSPGGAHIGRCRPPGQQPGCRKAHQQLAGGFNDLAHRRGAHISPALGIAPDGREHTHAKHRRSQHPDGRSRLTVVQQLRQGPRKQQHHTAAHHPQQEKHTCRHPEDALSLVHSAHGLRPGHQAGKGQGQPCRRHDEQKAIYVVGHIEMGHAVLIQQVSQGDLIHSPDNLGRGHRQCQDGSALHKVLLSPGQSHPSSRPLRIIFSLRDKRRRSPPGSSVSSPGG